MSEWCAYGLMEEEEHYFGIADNDLMQGETDGIHNGFSSLNFIHLEAP